MEYKLDFRTYSDALKKNKLLGLKCNDCGTFTCPPKMTCQECAGTDLEIVELSGNGEIVTFTQTFVAPQGRECEAPYTIVMVELDEGPWTMGNLIDIAPDKINMELIGRKVRLGHKVFPGDTYSDGEAARPLFSFQI
ncbi:MAG: Zn-ribbon domain-containing OB-fold protein [Pseudomonadota bacterium]|nr:Zn-ribbon domain-containing OB-fold protein [Pseudomonadota bacterium]